MIPNKKYLDYEGLKYYHTKLIRSINERFENFTSLINEKISQFENRLNNDDEVQLGETIPGKNNIKIIIDTDNTDPVTIYSDEQTNEAITQAITQEKEDIYGNVDGTYYNY